MRFLITADAPAEITTQVLSAIAIFRSAVIKVTSEEHCLLLILKPKLASSLNPVQEVYKRNKRQYTTFNTVSKFLALSLFSGSFTSENCTSKDS